MVMGDAGDVADAADVGPGDVELAVLSNREVFWGTLSLGAFVSLGFLFVAMLFAAPRHLTRRPTDRPADQLTEHGTVVQIHEPSSSQLSRNQRATDFHSSCKATIVKFAAMAKVHPSSETSLVASAQSRNVVQEHCALFHHPVSYLHCGTAISEAHGNTCPNRSVFPKSVLLGQIKLLLTLWRDPIPGLPKAPPSCCKDDIQEAPKRNMMTNFSIVARSERCKPWNRLSVSMAHARPVAQRSGHFQLLCASIPESRPEYCT
ncbi:predicted protein [Plenodomus lingam JN3]|uniref:Predicted protein n=1 Tax=Leptosphaeria maculans (strain JN3 / isolate v23.1.3 / race Av1-4-5-6-7-8) TaxID=985895 RepID=E5A3G1_LEPMJ|nr:predicted protein [Plenodomus lingam JN3]CBX98174.1 predicted protein [Plenodomus lingam JN3]